eukprot:scaffold8111_cov444-Prasinococcus_capsulatus_cf.AAC.1
MAELTGRPELQESYREWVRRRHERLGAWTSERQQLLEEHVGTALVVASLDNGAAATGDRLRHSRPEEVAPAVATTTEGASAPAPAAVDDAGRASL